MEYLSTIFVLLISTCFCTAVPLARRVKILERDSREKLFIITSDLIDLQDRWDAMNSTVHQNIGGLSPSDIVASIRAMEDKLNKFIQVQSANQVAMSRAINVERDFKKNYEILMPAIKTFLKTIGPTTLEMAYASKLNTAELERIHTQMNEFKTNMNAELGAVRNDTKFLNAKIIDMIGIPAQ